MRLKQYCKGIESLIASSPFLSSNSITIDERPADTVFIKGQLTFLDGSELHFMEFLFFGSGIIKEKYSYHYMKSGKLLFRYDNALDPKAKSLPTFPYHKHVGKKMLPAAEPTLKEILDEIESSFSKK